MALEHDRLSGIVGTIVPTGAALTAIKRRAKARIKRMHHHAIFTKDAGLNGPAPATPTRAPSSLVP